jgi:VanZ family protein
MRWLARAWPALVWAAIIALFSTHWFTESNTSRVIFPLLRFLFPHASYYFLFRAEHIIRKGAHIFEYFVFSLLLLRTIRGERAGWRLTWGIAAILIVFGYACTDELHQALVPGRGPAFADVMLDTAAGILAQVAAGMWAAFRGKKSPSVPAE